MLDLGRVMDALDVLYVRVGRRENGQGLGRRGLGIWQLILWLWQSRRDLRHLTGSCLEGRESRALVDREAILGDEGVAVALLFPCARRRRDVGWWGRGSRGHMVDSTGLEA